MAEPEAQQAPPSPHETTSSPPPSGSGGAIVVSKHVVSKPGAQVIEVVYVLSEGAARRLQTNGKIPAR